MMKKTYSTEPATSWLKTIVGKAAVVLAFVLILAGCGIPANLRTGTLSITMPGSANTAGRTIRPPDSVLKQLEYRLIFNGPGVQSPIVVPAGGTISVSLVPGRWEIVIYAYHGDIRVGSGVVTVDIVGGQNSQAPVPMGILDGFFDPPQSDASVGFEWDWAGTSRTLSIPEDKRVEAVPGLREVRYQWFRWDLNGSSETEEGSGPDLTLGADQWGVFGYRITVLQPVENGNGMAPVPDQDPVEVEYIAVVPRSSYGLRFLIDRASDGVFSLDLPAGDFVMTNSVEVNRAVTLRGAAGGTRLIRQPGFSFEMFDVDARLDLDGNLTLYGDRDNDDVVAIAALVGVNGGVLTMHNGVTITGNYNEESLGGGVFIEGGEFIMLGGTISNNEAGGLNGSGGGVLVERGEFRMVRGTVFGNEQEHQDAETANSASAGAALFVATGGTGGKWDPDTNDWVGRTWVDFSTNFTIINGEIVLPPLFNTIIQNDDTIAITGLTNAGQDVVDADDGALVIPSEIGGLLVTTISANAFLNNQLTSVTIPGSVTGIWDNAFFNNNLSSVTIEGSPQIGQLVFWDNNDLTSITIGPDVTFPAGSDANEFPHNFVAHYNAFAPADFPSGNPITFQWDGTNWSPPAAP